MRFLKPCVTALLAALCYAMPASASAQQGQWTLTPDKQHFHPVTSGSANVSEIAVWDHCEVYGYECSPLGNGSASTSNSWALVWTGTGVIPQAKVQGTLYVDGGATGGTTPNTASGVSDLNGDLGALHVNWPASKPSYTYSYTLIFTANATIHEATSASVTGIRYGDAYSSASAQLVP